jgi:hypothetical protein
MRVTERAVVARINRRLRQDDEVLRKTRSRRAWLDLGDFYVVNTRINGIVAKFCDPEDLARELGLLRPGDVVAR